jgi:hypothetical protein
MSKPVDLDATKLLGFRLCLVSRDDADPAPAVLGPKVGEKVGDKPIVGAAVGAKVGTKPPPEMIS